MLLVRVVSVILLLLGLLAPVANNLADIFLGFLLFGFASGVVLGVGLGLLVLPAGWALYVLLAGFKAQIIWGALGGLLLALVLARLRVVGDAGLKISIAVVVLVFLASVLATNGELVRFLSRDLPLYTYNNDPGVIYKTYLLLESDFNYYDAYKTAQLGRFEQQIIPGDIWGWRLPTIFLIWKMLPGTGGLAVYYFFLVLAALALFCAYKIGSRYLGEKLGLLSAYLVFPYFHFAARDQMFLETEWWAVIFFIFGVFLLVRQVYFWAILLFSLTVLVREIYILPLGLMLAWSLWKKREAVGVFLIPILAFAIFYFFHILWVSDYINAWGTLLAPRTVDGSLFLIQQTLAFASWEYLLFRLRPFLLFLVAATAGVTFLVKHKKLREEGVFWLLAFLPFPIAFLRFGTVPYNDYWGIIYMPLVLILSALALLTVKPEK